MFESVRVMHFWHAEYQGGAFFERMVGWCVLVCNHICETTSWGNCVGGRRGKSREWRASSMLKPFGLQ